MEETEAGEAAAGKTVNCDSIQRGVGVGSVWYFRALSDY